MESVRKFVENWQASGKQLHVLVNNAGSMPAFKDNTRHFTPENFEQTIGTNYLGTVFMFFSCTLHWFSRSLHNYIYIYIFYIRLGLYVSLFHIFY